MSQQRGPWRKSTRSNSTGNGDCVEARVAQEGFELRDSKLGDNSPIFGISAGDFGILISSIKTNATE